MRKAAIVLVLTLLMGSATVASAASVWGTASDINGYYGGSVIFKTDLDSGATTILRTYTWSSDSIMWFGDIAHSQNGYLYATAYEYSAQTGFSDGFDQLLKISPVDGSILGRLDVGDKYNQMNALTAIDSNMLYGVEGGGLMNANLVEITLDNNGDFDGSTRLGVVGDLSDGDIAYDKASGNLFVGSFWDDGSPVLRSIEINNGVASGSNYVALKKPYTSGLVFDNDTMWASAWTDMKLYTVDIDLNSSTRGEYTYRWDLSNALNSGDVTVTGITGLSAVAVPEPITMIALGGSLAGLGGYIRRRRRA